MPSKYDDLARNLLMFYDADAVCCVVVNGPHGDGACHAETPDMAMPQRLELQKRLAEVLRNIADRIERGTDEGRDGHGNVRIPKRPQS